MPELSRFLGIVIGMFREHGVPHFHAVYGEHEISVEVETGRTLGNCPPRAVGVTTMNYHIVEARYEGGYSGWLRFRDGTAGEIDLASELHGPVFEPLKDAVAFRAFKIHPEFHTLVWPNGADLAPEFLHDNVRATA